MSVHKETLSLLKCAAPGRSSQCRTRGFPGLTANPQHTHLVPPGVCGSWPLLAVWDPRFSWTHRQPATQQRCILSKSILRQQQAGSCGWLLPQSDRLLHAATRRWISVLQSLHDGSACSDDVVNIPGRATMPVPSH